MANSNKTKLSKPFGVMKFERVAYYKVKGLKSGRVFHKRVTLRGSKFTLQTSITKQDYEKVRKRWKN